MRMLALTLILLPCASLALGPGEAEWLLCCIREEYLELTACCCCCLVCQCGVECANVICLLLCGVLAGLGAVFPGNESYVIATPELDLAQGFTVGFWVRGRRPGQTSDNEFPGHTGSVYTFRSAAFPTRRVSNPPSFRWPSHGLQPLPFPSLSLPFPFPSLCFPGKISQFFVWFCVWGSNILPITEFFFFLYVCVGFRCL